VLFLTDRRKNIRLLKDALKHSRVRWQGSIVSESLSRKIDRLVEGDWSVEDVIETHFDEISTTSNVGTGVERPLGHMETLRKLLSWVRGRVDLEVLSSEEGLRETARKVARRFFDEVLPDAPQETVEGFLSWLKEP
jgi:hypothetical protein